MCLDMLYLSVSFCKIPVKRSVGLVLGEGLFMLTPNEFLFSDT